MIIKLCFLLVACALCLRQTDHTTPDARPLLLATAAGAAGAAIGAAGGAAAACGLTCSRNGKKER
eukprot:evm.model.NODE_35128_length_10898_cov_26.649937.1